LPVGEKHVTIQKTSPLLWIILTRHAECHKNIRDEHGGTGDTLTRRGRRQLRTIAENIRGVVEEFGIRLARICYSDVIQASETAAYLSERLGVPFVSDPRIAPLDLGVLAGLSRQRAAATYPRAAEQMEMWRRGELEIRELDLPSAESFNHFWSRGEEFVREIIADESSSVVVSSRSTLIMLLNMLLGRSPASPRSYHAWVFAHVSLAVFSHDDRWILRRSSGIRAADGKMLQS
jgi:broad specificity phosphatase PhoE